MKLDNKPILIIGAMKKELIDLIDKLENKKYTKLSIFDVYEGFLFGYPIVIAKSGVGLVRASSLTSLILEKYNPSFIINIGIAGGVTKNHHKKDIVIAEEVFNINSYMTPYKEVGEGSDSILWDYKQFTDGGEDVKRVYKTDKKLLELICGLEIEYTEGKVFTGIVGSGDVWNREKDRLNYFDDVHNVACEDMEAVAIYEIAENYCVPCLSIKIMSDNELLGEDYEPIVATYCQKYVEKLVEKLVKNWK